jgi:hypothetical protein
MDVSARPSLYSKPRSGSTLMSSLPTINLMALPSPSDPSTYSPICLPPFRRCVAHPVNLCQIPLMACLFVPHTFTHRVSSLFVLFFFMYQGGCQAYQQRRRTTVRSTVPRTASRCLALRMASSWAMMFYIY